MIHSRHVLVLAFIALLSVNVFAQEAIDPLKDLDFSKTSLKQNQIQKLEMYDLKLLRGIIFGRHGRVFKDSDIKGYLEEQPWFKPNPDFKNSMLNDVERRNLDLIRIAEAVQRQDMSGAKRVVRCEEQRDGGIAARNFFDDDRKAQWI